MKGLRRVELPEMRGAGQGLARGGISAARLNFRNGETWRGLGPVFDEPAAAAAYRLLIAPRLPARPAAQGVRSGIDGVIARFVQNRTLVPAVQPDDSNGWRAAIRKSPDG
jgi:hypothetical protein